VQGEVRFGRSAGCYGGRGEARTDESEEKTQRLGQSLPLRGRSRVLKREVGEGGVWRPRLRKKKEEKR